MHTNAKFFFLISTYNHTAQIHPPNLSGLVAGLVGSEVRGVGYEWVDYTPSASLAQLQAHWLADSSSFPVLGAEVVDLG